MYFRVAEIFDYVLDIYAYDIYREEQVIYHHVNKATVEIFVMDRSQLHDSDVLEYGWGCLGCISGREAREILSQKDAVPPILSNLFMYPTPIKLKILNGVLP